MSQSAFAVVEIDENGSARLLESAGDVELCHRDPCAGGHPAANECDLCHGECLGDGASPSAA